MPPSSGKKNNTAHSNDITDIKEQLSLLAEPAYRDFSSSLLPGTEHILGVRLPALRKIARKLAKENWLENLARCTQDSFEEIMLQGFIIGYAKAPLPDILEQIAAFLPKMRQLLHHPQGGRGEPRRVLGLPAALHPIR